MSESHPVSVVTVRSYYCLRCNAAWFLIDVNHDAHCFVVTWFLLLPGFYGYDIAWFVSDVALCL